MIVLLLTILHTLSFQLYWWMEGVREGYYYDRLPMIDIFGQSGNPNKPLLKKQKNIKRYFVIQRSVMVLWFLIVAAFLIKVNNNLIIYCAGLILTQPFIHLGTLYYTRNKLNASIYQKGFFCNASLTSTALIDIQSKRLLLKLAYKYHEIFTSTPILRIVLFSLGLFMILISLL
jgi:hypothetical protein